MKRKVLIIIATVAVMLSVMGVVAVASQSNVGSPFLADAAISTTKTTAVPNTSGALENISQWWKNFYPQFDKGYKDAFLWVSQVLATMVGWLFQIIGFAGTIQI